MVLSRWLAALPQAHHLLNPRLAALRQQIVNDPYYRFRSVEELQLAATLGIQIDVNQATVDDWLRLPGLSIHQARALVELTQAQIQFHCLEDIAAALGVGMQRLQPLQPILRFCYYATESIHTIQRVNPNTASLESLTQVPAIDAYLAKTIVQKRQTDGPYRNLADLQRRLYLPASLTSELLHYLRF